jgi:hypothetical protein
LIHASISFEEKWMAGSNPAMTDWRAEMGLPPICHRLAPDDIFQWKQRSIEKNVFQGLAKEFA